MASSSASFDGIMRSCTSSDQGHAGFFLQGHGGDRALFIPFVIGPDQAGGRGHFDISAEEGHGLIRRRVAHHQMIPTHLCGHRPHRRSRSGRGISASTSGGTGPACSQAIELTRCAGPVMVRVTTSSRSAVRSTLLWRPFPRRRRSVYLCPSTTSPSVSSSSTTLSSSSKRDAQNRRCSSIHAVSSASRRTETRPRPDLSAVTSPALQDADMLLHARQRHVELVGKLRDQHPRRLFPRLPIASRRKARRRRRRRGGLSNTEPYSSVLADKSVMQGDDGDDDEAHEEAAYRPPSSPSEGREGCGWKLAGVSATLPSALRHQAALVPG